MSEAKRVACPYAEVMDAEGNVLEVLSPAEAQEQWDRMVHRVSELKAEISVLRAERDELVRKVAELQRSLTNAGARVAHFQELAREMRGDQ